VPQLKPLKRAIAGCADLVGVGFSLGEACLDGILHPPSA